MNTIDLSTWGQFFARLGIGLCAIVALAFVTDAFVKSSSWRRAIWQTALVCSLLLVGVEATGLQKGLGVWLFGKAVPERVATVRVIDPIPDETPIVYETTAIAPSMHFSKEPFQLPKNCWWPAGLWFAGAASVLARILFAQGVFMVFRSKRKQLFDPALLGEIKSLSEQLKLGRRVKVYELDRVSGPIAFGVARPGIGVPKGFTEQFTLSQQQAMLAHELAHLRSRDPYWYLVANFATALFWWHPGVWWMRRQLHVASEFAADEAVLLLKNGPVTLAECLLTFGRQLTGARPLDALGVGGFRSNLGKRVEALLSLDERTVRISKAWHQTVVKVVAPICLMAALVCTVGWFENRELQKGSDFESTVQVSWDGSIAALTFSAAKEEREMRIFLAGGKNTPTENGGAPSVDGSRAAQTFRNLEQHKVPQLELQKTPLEEALKLLGAAIGSRGNVPYQVTVTNEVFITAAVTNVSMQSALNAIVSGADKPIAYSVDSRGVLTIKDDKASKTVTYTSPSPIDPANQEKARLFIEEAESLYKASKFDLARSKLVEALQLDPESEAAKYYLQLIEQRKAQPKPNSGLIHPTIPPKEAVPSVRSSLASSGSSQASEPAKKVQPVDPRFTTNEPSQLQTRSYKVDVTTMEASLAKLRSESKNSSGKTQNELLRDFFAQTGIEINAPKALFYNDATGLLIVRATQEDQEIVEQGVYYLNATRPQIMIEAKFAEVDRELLRTSGGELFMGSKVVNSSLIKRKSLPVGGRSKDPADNDLSISGFTPTNAVESTFEGILSPTDFRSLIKTLEETSGADVLTSPKVTTLSGRQAQISVLDIRTIVTGLETVKSADGASSSEFKTQPLEFGPTLDVIPEVSVDNFSVKMTVIATLREFLGYEEPHRALRKVNEVEGQLPLPKMRVRQITTAAEVPDGHTLVLGGLISDSVQKTKQVLPILGRGTVGRLSRVEHVKTEKRHLTVFVTPTIIDNTGRPINKSN